MSDQINQIQATFDPIEDRILLKFKTLSEEVYNVWVTRRFCKLLIPILQGHHPKTGENILSSNKTVHLQFDQEQAAMDSNYSEEYQLKDTPQYPLGEAPVLLAKIGFQDLNSSHPVFKLEPNKGQGLILPYEAKLLGPLLRIINQALNKADWSLELEEIYHLPDPKAAVH